MISIRSSFAALIHGKYRNWMLTAPWHGAMITVPAKFIGGDKDTGVESFGIKHYIESGAFKFSVPDLEVAIIEGHHYLQQEQAERVNSEILSFLDKFFWRGDAEIALLNKY